MNKLKELGQENNNRRSDVIRNLVKNNVPVVEPVKQENEEYYQREALRRKIQIAVVIFDSFLLLLAVAIYAVTFRDDSKDCLASKDYDYPFTKNEIPAGVTKYVNVTVRFNRMLLVFVMSFMLSLVVDACKICIKFDTRKTNRVLVLLRFVHLLTLIDLIVITILRFDHVGETCFCHDNDDPPYDEACMRKLHQPIELFIIILWGIVGIAMLSACCACCYYCR